MRNVVLYALCLTLTAAVVYLCTPLYWISEAVYWESVHQSREEQNAIRWVLGNRRVQDKWPNSFRAVILDGAVRGIHRDFTYRATQKWTRLPDWTPIPPVFHAMRNGLLFTWVQINVDTFTFMVGYYTGLRVDPTDEAVFYRVIGHRNSWFDRQIRNGKMCKTMRSDAHEFYRRCLVSLSASKESEEYAHRYAVRYGYPFYAEGDAVRTSHVLVQAQESEHLTFGGVSYPYALPAVLLYMERLSGQYARSCGEPLMVTEVLHLASERPITETGDSVHPAGMAFDVGVTQQSCTGWLRAAFLIGERRGYVDATEKTDPQRFHVVVFSHQYLEWLVSQIGAD